MSAASITCKMSSLAARMGSFPSVHLPATRHIVGREAETMDDPVEPERGGVKRRGMVVGLLLLGLVAGGFVGSLIGGIVGDHKDDAAEAAGECFSYFEVWGFGYVGEYAFFGLLLGALLGAILGGLAGVWLNSRRRAASR